ncbi:MAG: DUF933 domain-containing protein [Thermodesulfobacteriota bacterium]
MKLGIVGLEGAGKTTLFEALTRSEADAGHRNEDRLAVIPVPDRRVDVLTGMYKPRKTIYAQIEYCLPAGIKKNERETRWNSVKECDALIQVVRNFELPGGDPATPYKDMAALDEEFILADYMVVEKRLERIEADSKRGKKGDPGELTLLRQAREMLESNQPLRQNAEISVSPLMRGFTFLSAKPALVLINNDDDNQGLPPGEPPAGADLMVVRGRLEHEISRMSDEEAADFLKEFAIDEPATARAIKRSYQTLGLISFFTVGEDEVRAWTIKKETPAVKAAGVIHSDMEKGFIRAEVVAYDDLISAGSYAEARKRGTTRLEGKTYIMADGDIVTIRFNV